MKKLLNLSLIFVLAALVGCTAKTNKETTTVAPTTVTTTVNEEEEKLKNLITPFWKSETMYDETVILVAETDAEGNVISMPKGNLLFSCDEIVEVKQYFHADNKGIVTFKEGEDFTVEGNTITAIGTYEEDLEGIKTVNTKMPYITDKQMSGEAVFPGFGSTYTSIPSNSGDHDIPYTETYLIVQMQISVTYKHSETWTKETPAYQGDILSNVVSKLENKEETNILVFGDSISTGSNSSSILGITPNLEPWYDLMTDGLKMHYGANVILTNKSMGGWTSQDGVSVSEKTGWVKGQQVSQAGLPTLLKTDLADYTPDLVIIGFGMNDATLGITLNAYAKNIMTMIDAVLERNPNCDIILLGTMLANPDAKDQSKNQTEYSALNEKIASQYDGVTKAKANVVSVNIGTMHQNLLDSGKKYMDMTGNNVNHPNDFMARIYCMNLLETLIKD